MIDEKEMVAEEDLEKYNELKAIFDKESETLEFVKLRVKNSQLVIDNYILQLHLKYNLKFGEDQITNKGEIVRKNKGEVTDGQ